FPARLATRTNSFDDGRLHEEPVGASSFALVHTSTEENLSSLLLRGIDATPDLLEVLTAHYGALARCLFERIANLQLACSFYEFCLEFFVDGTFDQDPASAETYLSLVAEGRFDRSAHHLLPIAICEDDVRILSSELE